MRAIYVALLGASFAVAASNLNAAQIAFDTAGDSAYNSFNGLAPYPNGGYGWGGPWQGQMSMGSSSLNGFGDPQGTGDINSPRTPSGRAWEVFDSPDNDLVFGASRQFGSALLPGQTFSIDLDTGAVAPAAGPVFFAFEEGFTLGSVSPLGGVTTGFRFMSSPEDSPDFVVATSTGMYVTAVPLTDRGVHVAVTQLDGAQVHVSITSFAAGAASDSFALADSVPLDTVTIVNEEPRSATPDNRDLYFNDIAITPEPTNLFLFALGVIGVTLKRRVHGIP